VRDLSINLLASIITGVAVWLAQFLLRRRRLNSERAFFGLTDGGTCLLAAPRHHSSPSENSVHRRDVAALVELATLAQECGARADLSAEGVLAQGFGRMTEFCVGGPTANPRTATHLRTILRGVTYPAKNLIAVGGAEFAFELDLAEYVVLARGWGPARDRPVFVLSGQTAQTNLAAARYLHTRHRALARQYGADRPFCLILRIVEQPVYGADFVELAADVTDDAFRPVLAG
jgi:hypothetical protein